VAFELGRPPCGGGIPLLRCQSHSPLFARASSSPRHLLPRKPEGHNNVYHCRSWEALEALERDFSSASSRKSTSAGEIVNGGRTLSTLLSRPVVPTRTPRRRRSLTIRAASWRPVNFVMG